MTITQIQSPAPTTTSMSSAVGGGVVGQVKQAVPTAGSPVQQTGKEPSWFAKNVKLLGIVGGAAVGGAIGFLTLGPIGGLGGAAVGALAGYMLTRNSTSGGGEPRQSTPPLQTAPPLPPT